MLSKDQMRDHTGAKSLYPHLPAAKTLIAGKGYDSDKFRDALSAAGMAPCVPPTSNGDIVYHNGLYKRRGRIESIFSGPKDWRRIALRYDRAAHTFFSAIAVAATDIWL